MAIAQYGSLRSQLPALTAVATSGGSITSSGTLFFSLQGRNRAGHNLPSAVVSVSYLAGQQIQVTIPATARVAGEDIRRFVISAGSTSDSSTHQQIAVYEGFDSDQETLRSLPVTLAFTRDEHLVLGGSVAALSNLPSGVDLVNGMLREVTDEAKILRYESESVATIDNAVTYSAAPNAGRWTVYGAFSTYQENTRDAGGSDRPVASVPLAALIRPPVHPADGSEGTPVNIWLIADRLEGAGSVAQGKRIGFNVYLNGINKSSLFDAQLLLTLKGFVRLSDGTLDTSGLTTAERIYRFGKAGAQILEKPLPSGYALSYDVAIALDQNEINEPIAADTPIRVEPFFYAQSGTPNPVAAFTGDAIYSEGDRRRVVPGDGLSIIALSGSGTIAGVEFPLQEQSIVTGLASDTDGQVISINGDGVTTIETDINSLRVTQRLRAYVGTLSGLSSAGAFSPYGAVSANQELTVTLNHPTDGTLGTIRADYLDVVAGNAKAEFNPVLLRVYVQRQSDGEIREFSGYVVVTSPTQDVTISTWASGSVVGSLPLAPSSFSLFAPGGSTFIASGGGGDFAADSYRVAFAYEYDGGQVTAIDHSSPPAVYEIGGSVSQWDQTATEWDDAQATLAYTNQANVYTRAQRSQPFNLSIAAGVVALDCSLSNTFLLTLTENVTQINLSNLVSGASFDIQISQDGTGGRTVSWPSVITWAGGNALTPSPAPNAIDVVSFKSFNGINLRAAAAQGFA